MITTDMPSNQDLSFLGRTRNAYDCVIALVETSLDGWFIELSARLLFAFTLMVYYLNSALTKVGDGLFGIFAPSAGAFAQIAPPVAEQYFYDTTAIPFFPWHLIVIAGTLAEIVLPILIVIGLFTRLAALGMIGFVVVQTIVDIAFHGSPLGSWFNNQASELLDQRMLWIFPLLLLVVKGAGSFSIDALLQRFRKT